MEDRVVEEARLRERDERGGGRRGRLEVERDRERAAVGLEDELVGLLRVEPLLRRLRAAVLARRRRLDLGAAARRARLRRLVASVAVVRRGRRSGAVVRRAAASGREQRDREKENDGRFGAPADRIPLDVRRRAPVVLGGCAVTLDVNGQRYTVEPNGRRLLGMLRDELELLRDEARLRRGRLRRLRRAARRAARELVPAPRRGGEGHEPRGPPSPRRGAGRS